MTFCPSISAQIANRKSARHFYGRIRAHLRDQRLKFFVPSVSFCRSDFFLPQLFCLKCLCNVTHVVLRLEIAQSWQDFLRVAKRPIIYHSPFTNHGSPWLRGKLSAPI
jgi:hypothetical protein